MSNIPRLTDLETIIMKVLWQHDRGLTIQEITACIEEKKISTASVAQAVKHMLAKEAIEVGKHVPVANVYARTFATCFSQKEFLASEFSRMQEAVYGRRCHTAGIAAAFLGSESAKNIEAEEMDELQKIIDEKKKQMKKQKNRKTGEKQNESFHHVDSNCLSAEFIADYLCMYSGKKGQCYQQDGTGMYDFYNAGDDIADVSSV